MAGDSSFLEQEFPLDYCSSVAKQIFAQILKKESFSLIGVKDVCKSNLLRFIGLRKDVQRKYLGKKNEDFLFVLVDLNELAQPSLAGFYKLIDLSLIEPFKKGKLLNDLFSSDPVILLKILKKDILQVIRKTKKTIVFLFINFDDCFNLDPEILVTNLISFRQAARFRTIFVFSGTRPFKGKVFFFQKIVWQKPFVRKDAFGVIERNLRRYQLTASAAQKEAIFYLSGGHPGLIKFICQLLPRIETVALLDNEDIVLQCGRILEGLTPIEIAKLKIGEKDELLISLGVQREKGDSYVPFSSLIQKYLETNTTVVNPFCFDKENEEIYFWGKPIKAELTQKEFLLLKLLIVSPKKVFRREEIMEKVWGEEEFPSDWAFDKLISRLRKKLNDNPGKVKYLKTIRNLGLALS